MTNSPLISDSAVAAPLSKLLRRSKVFYPRQGDQNSLTLNPSIIASAFASNGQSVPTTGAFSKSSVMIPFNNLVFSTQGQSPSLTSTNNFINFCALETNRTRTGGLQVRAGSCNAAPMGIIPARTRSVRSFNTKFID